MITGNSSIRKSKQNNKLIVNVYIYLRCSTESQSTDTHEAEITDYCQRNYLTVDSKNIYRDQAISGNKSWQDRQIKTIIDKCTKGDHIVVSELSRLSRRARDLYNIVHACTEKGINLHCVKGGFKNDGSMESSLLLGMLSTMSQYERELAVARSKSSAETKRRKGIKLGRELFSPLESRRMSIEVDVKNGLSINELTVKYKTTRSSISSFMKVRNIEHKNKIQNIILSVPPKSSAGKKIRGSMYDKYIDDINIELQDPNVTLKCICGKYDFKYDSFYLWFKSRSQE